MDTVHSIWAGALVVALLLTLLAVMRLLAVLSVAREILFLARRTLPAAQGIATHTGHLGKLPVVAPPLEGIASASAGIHRATGNVLGLAKALLEIVPDRGAAR